MQNDSATESSAPVRPLRHLLAVVVKVLLCIVLCLGAYAAYEVAQNNFHAVVPGLVYRSSRMSPAALTATMEQHGIKSVLSLIGPSLAKSNAVQRSGGTYFDISLSDRLKVTDARMEQIVTVLRSAPKPVLIHCKAGADRTGLAAALYHYAIGGQPADQADDSLTLLYGHLPPWLGFATRAMDQSFWRYAASHSPGCGTNQLN